LPAGPALVVGLARSGVAAGLVLRERGIEVVGCDSGPVPAESRERLEAAGVAVYEQTDGSDLLGSSAWLVKSPGVPASAPVVAAARRDGVPVLGEIELGWRLLGNEFLAVTGSNGKTTTAELLGHIHRTAGVSVKVAGNVGTAITSLVGSVDPGAVLVCEVSSFQLEDTIEFAPEAALLLNIVEDHLDRHGTLAAYREAKLRVFANQPPGAIAVLPAGMAGDADIGGDARRVTFGPGGDIEAGGAAAAAGTGGAAGARPIELRWRGEPFMAASELRLRGPHNLENAMAAAAVALARGLPAASVREALATFAGVEHRLEEVATVDGVLYVNDSKATNVASAIVGIESFPGGVHAILGGSRKGSDYTPLAAPIAERAAAVYLIGETAPDVRAALEQARVPLHDCGDLEHAVDAARRAARPGDVVLLSPASASYDQYRSFEDRGRHFRALVAR
jgi:UDP-N-acetylmuramoylalanine--D-glutamate ligase